jgi:predicted dithiol-disulfide oxidoreductase (DUF899 family)
VEKDYRFHTEQGVKSLADLFDGRSQLIVYHFMFGPDWDEGCDGCSFLSDHFDGPNLHLPHHDVTLAVISRAPLEKLLAFKRRMGWEFQWVSSEGSDFNFDFDASSKAGERYLYNFEEESGGDSDEEHHGMSVFYRQADGGIFRTYACHARGVDPLCGTHQLLDLTPKGRNENGTMDWVRLHDRYESSSSRSCGCSDGSAPTPNHTRP